MKRRISFFMLAIVCVFICSAQNMQRTIPRQQKSERKQAAEVVVSQYDTIVPSCESVIVAGFEKPLRENKETMFITNKLQREITSVTLQINYLDSEQRQLHKAEHSVWVDIPAGETRRIEVKSFDRSKLFYYHKTALTGHPKQATPFWVEVRVMNVTHLKQIEQ